MSHPAARFTPDSLRVYCNPRPKSPGSASATFPVRTSVQPGWYTT